VIAPYVELARLHAPLLCVLAPLIGAALAIAVPAARASWAIVVMTGLATAALAVDLAVRALLGREALAQIAEGMALRAEGWAVFTVGVVAVCAALAAIATGAFMREVRSSVAPFAMALLPCIGAGWSGALLARDLLGVLTGMEAAWLAATGLLALTGDRQRGALNGAMRMLSAGGAGAALFIIGAAVLQRSVGSLDVAAISVTHIAAPNSAAVGAGLILVGVALKAGAAPLHAWVGAAYGRAGSLAAVALGVVGAVGAAAVLGRLAIHMVMAPAIGEGLSVALATLGWASVVIGSMQAVGARNLRRLAGYAGVAQLGGVLMCVALGSPAGVAAALVQLVAFAAAALALFVGAAAGGVHAIEGLDGMGKRAPVAAAAITAGAISLMGAPLTLGFLGRWRLVEAGVGAGWWWAAGAVIFLSLAGVFYGGRLVERLYFRRAAGAYAGGQDLWTLALAPALLASVLIIAAGLAPAPLLDAADAAARLLMGGAP
jgi:multicomponent Na+:H+ antiporter subunit D